MSLKSHLENLNGMRWDDEVRQRVPGWWTYNWERTFAKSRLPWNKEFVATSRRGAKWRTSVQLSELWYKSRQCTLAPFQARLCTSFNSICTAPLWHTKPVRKWCDFVISGAVDQTCRQDKDGLYTLIYWLSSVQAITVIHSGYYEAVAELYCRRSW